MRILILIIITTSMNTQSQILNYAEDGNFGHPYPYKDYPPEVQTIRYFSLIHQYLLKDNPKNMMPASNIIDLEGSYIVGSKFTLNIMDGWRFQSIESSKAREIKPEDIRYSIDQASLYLRTLSQLEINFNTIKIQGNSKVILNTNKTQLREADSLDICNALRRIIIVPYGSGDNLSSFKRYPVGAGPFYENDRSGYELHLSSDETADYYFGIPLLEDIYIKRVIKFKQESKLKSLKIDLMLDANIFNYLNLCGKSEYRCKSVASDFVNLLVINHRSQKMGIKEFREALAYAIDKVGLANLYDGSILNGSLSSRNIFHNNSIIPRGFDLGKSKELIESLGYYMDGTGLYQDPATGKSIIIKILYNKNEPQEIIANLESYFYDMGLEVKKIPKSNIGITKLLKTKSEDQWDIYYRSEKMQSNQFIRSYYHSGEMSSNNWGGYRNKNIDLLLDRFQNEDGTGKSKLGPQIHEKLYEDVAVIGLFVNPTWAIFHQYVKPFIVPWYYFDQPHKWKTNK